MSPSSLLAVQLLTESNFRPRAIDIDDDNERNVDETRISRMSSSTKTVAVVGVDVDVDSFLASIQQLKGCHYLKDNSFN